jgi:hypothetical protein
MVWTVPSDRLNPAGPHPVHCIYGIISIRM